MRKLILAAIVMSAAYLAQAQDNTIKDLKDNSKKTFEDDTTFKQGWKTGGLISLNLAQGALSNWQGGGDKSSFFSGRAHQFFLPGSGRDDMPGTIRLILDMAL